jgi:hypothetical protein
MASLVHALRAASAGGEVIAAQGATINLEKVCPAQKR